jgi:transcription elongation factor Elf1
MNEIECPHCGLEIIEECSEYMIDLKEGQETEIECKECGKEFLASYEVTFCWSKKYSDAFIGGVAGS